MNIVICCDGTTSAKAAIVTGIQMCRAFHATLHIVTSVIVKDSEKFEFIEEEPSKEQNTLNKAKIILAEAAELLQEENIPCKSHLLNRGLAPGEDLVAFTKEINADFIIMGIRQKSRLGKFLLGSSAQHAALKAHCPVIVIPPCAKEAILNDNY